MQLWKTEVSFISFTNPLYFSDTLIEHLTSVNYIHHFCCWNNLTAFWEVWHFQSCCSFDGNYSHAKEVQGWLAPCTNRHLQLRTKEPLRITLLSQDYSISGRSGILHSLKNTVFPPLFLLAAVSDLILIIFKKCLKPSFDLLFHRQTA